MRASPPTRSDRRRAFSVIELVIAIGVLLLIAALVAPSLSGFADRIAFEQSVANLELAANRARLEARRLGREVRLIARSDGENWWLQVVSTDPHASDGPANTTLFEVDLAVAIEQQPPLDAQAPELAPTDFERADDSARSIQLAHWHADGAGTLDEPGFVRSKTNRVASLAIRELDGRGVVSPIEDDAPTSTLTEPQR